MAKKAKIALVMLLTFLVSVAPAIAHDWIAVKLRGKVLELVDGTWQPIERGDAVSETHVVRTLGNARVVFQHGSETVELGPDTQIQIFRRARDGFVTVKQSFGEVTVEADVKNVRHFAVQTPYLAAVVKGTVFAVRSDAKCARVDVERGAVAVTSEADQSSVVVRAGQAAGTRDDGTLEVSAARAPCQWSSMQAARQLLMKPAATMAIPAKARRESPAIAETLATGTMGTMGTTGITETTGNPAIKIRARKTRKITMMMTTEAAR